MMGEKWGRTEMCTEHYHPKKWRGKKTLKTYLPIKDIDVEGRKILDYSLHIRFTLFRLRINANHLWTCYWNFELHKNKETYWPDEKVEGRTLRQGISYSYANNRFKKGSMLFKEVHKVRQPKINKYKIIQSVYKRMVRFQKLTRNLFLTLHGKNVHHQQRSLSKFFLCINHNPSMCAPWVKWHTSTR
jgi:hypothetical protein